MIIFFQLSSSTPANIQNAALPTNMFESQSTSYTYNLTMKLLLEFPDPTLLDTRPQTSVLIRKAQVIANVMYFAQIGEPIVYVTALREITN